MSDDSETPFILELAITTEFTAAPLTEEPERIIDFEMWPLTEAVLLMNEPSGRTSPSGIGKGNSSLFSI